MNDNGNSLAHYLKEHQQSDCFQYPGLRKLKRDVKQAQKYLKWNKPKNCLFDLSKTSQVSQLKKA